MHLAGRRPRFVPPPTLKGLRVIEAVATKSTTTELVKAILEWEDSHPNEAIPYQPTLTPPNEPLTLEKLREMGFRWQFPTLEAALADLV